MSDPIANALSQLEKMLEDHAHAGCLYPKADPFEHGVYIGKYQGVLKAKEVLQNVLSADAEANAKL